MIIPSRIYYNLLAVLAALSFGAVSVGAAQPAPAKTSKPKRFDLRRLERLKDLSSVEKAARGISLFQEEINEPSEPILTDFGVLDHYDAMAKIAVLLAEYRPDKGTLSRTAEATTSSELRMALTLTLGLLGEPQVLPELITFFGDVRNPPAYRFLAARCLRIMPDVRSPLTTATVLSNDPTARLQYVHDKSTNVIIGATKSYWLRAEALSILKALQKHGVPISEDIQGLMERCVLAEPVSFAEARAIRDAQREALLRAKRK